jgi:hypothetical protein
MTLNKTDEPLGVSIQPPLAATFRRAVPGWPETPPRRDTHFWTRRFFFQLAVAFDCNALVSRLESLRNSAGVLASFFRPFL